jgi:hypothetical protein
MSTTAAKKMLDQLLEETGVAEESIAGNEVVIGLLKEVLKQNKTTQEMLNEVLYQQNNGSNHRQNYSDRGYNNSNWRGGRRW